MQVVPCSHVDIIPVVAQRQIPWSRLSVGPFSSPVNTVADFPVGLVMHGHFVAQRQVPWSKLFV